MMRLLLLTVVCVGTSLATTISGSAQPRDGLTLDTDWRFLQADAPGAEQPAFDDAAWRALDVPHDWSIAGPFAETNKTGGAGGFLPSGIAWYRKSFPLPEEFADRRFAIEFDGVMHNSDVWINGHHLGHRPNGYVSFRYDLTDHLVFGDSRTNVLAVRCDTSAQPASRWYSGAGIYRHVRLLINDPVHLEPDGTFISTPQVTTTGATVRVENVVLNHSTSPREVLIQLLVMSPDGRRVARAKSSAQTIPAGGRAQFAQEVTVTKPQLWGLNGPKLYRAVSQVFDGRKLLDVESTPFGIREAKFTPDRGFMLNGRKVVLKGVCLHHDGGAFGAAVPLDVWEDRLVTLRGLGVNAIRTAHNPPAPDFLDLCDRTGFLVMDEFFDCWTVGKNRHDYHLYFKEWSKHDLADTVRRDRNHPSVILWSIGNEIHDTPKPAVAIPIARGLVEVCHEQDPTRPVTQALFRPNRSGDYTNGLADLLDVVGTNYRDNELLAAQRNRPEWKIVGTEQRHERETWLNLRDYPTHSGQFLWTGVDYLGESRAWPRIGHASGLLDRTGAIKPRAFERESWWGEKPMVRIARRTGPDDKLPTDPGYGGPEPHTQVQFADWNPRNPEPHDETVEAYSNCDEVELILNGKSLGSKPINANAAPRVWKVPYAPGTLKAVARNVGKVVATDELRTAGPAAALKLETRTKKLGSGWDDVAVVRVMVTDAQGVRVPRADDLISFDISGPGVVAAVDNGDNDSHEPFQASQRQAYLGRCTVFAKAKPGRGDIQVTASAPGLKPASLRLKLDASK